MRLKRLDIFAFKSFMERTSLTFPQGMSAIVGPNGCGKSNIIDAIRWAIGEQSARSLRGRQMEDVIFAGTHQHKPLGVAEVSLTLEPEGSHAPSAHSLELFAGASEVTLTRRLHRSGESEFLINRRPCRLKDIAHIFLGTGIGGRGYGVIEQGKVDQVIDQRPEERRALVEEAAGVSRYRAQRSETVRKLDAAQANLTRLDDVLAEIRRQLAGLERQRRQAERHLRLRAELRVLELAQAARQYLAAQEAQGQAAATEDNLACRERDALNLRSDLAAERARIEAQLAATMREREGVQERLSALRQEVSERRSKLSALEGELNHLGREEQRLSQAAAESRRRADQAQVGLFRCSAASRQAAQQRGEQEAEVALLPGKLAGAAAELEALRAASDTLKGELIGAMSARSEAANSLRQLTSRLSELSARRSRKEQEAERARSEVSALEERRSTAAAQIDEARAGLAAAVAEQESLERQSAQAKERQGELSARLRVRRVELEGLRSRLTHLSELSASARGEAAEGLRAAAKELGVPHFLLSEALELADPAFEAGVAAALGERLRAVVFERAEDAQRSLDLFRQRGRGTAVAVALDLAPGCGDGDALSFGPKLPGLAARLGGLRLVESLGEALAAGSAGCTITRDGAALLPGGWLTAAGKEPGSELLAWQREARRLAAEAEALGDEAEVWASELAAQEESVRSLAQGLQAATKTAREQGGRQGNLEQDLRGLTGRLASTTERLRLAELEAAHDRQAAEEIGAQIDEASARATSAASQVAGREAEAGAALARVREAERIHGTLLERLSTLKASLAVLTEREAAAGSEAERLRHEQTETEAQAASLTAEAGGVAARAAELATRRRALESELAELAGREEGLGGEMAGASDLAEGNRAALSAVAARLEGLEIEIEGLRRELSEGRLRRSELSLKLDSIAERARDLHDIDLAPHSSELAAAVAPDTDPVEEARRRREALLRLGEVNAAAPREHEELSERHADLLAQQQDVAQGVEQLRAALLHIDRTCRKQFMATFEALNDKLAQVFTTLFGGGTARLELVGDDPLEAGVDIVAQPPGKRLVHMSLLSGGEKAMGATALLFALHLLRPSPFYLLDELDAALDDANVERLNQLLRGLSGRSQLILVTHNKKTLEMADTLYGVTMQEPGVSKLVSVKLSEVAPQSSN